MLLAYNISPSSTSVGVIANTFSPYIVSKLGEATTYADIVGKVNNVKIASSDTNLNSAVQLARTALFSVENGARAGVPKSLVIFVNGKLDVNMNDLGQEVSALQKAGVKIILIGIDVDGDMSVMKPLVDAWFFPPGLPELRRIVIPTVIATLPGM